LVSGLVVAQEEEERMQPNILFILADDLGWNDVDWHDPELSTPNLENMCHSTAVELNNSYANMLCSMTRSALLTGYDAYHIGTHTQVIAHQEPVGIPLKFPFFGERLQQMGYKTYMTGKWHMGFCKKEYLPGNRGFDRFTGMYLGDGDHFWNHWMMYIDNFGVEQRGYYMTKEENGERTIDYAANGTYSSEFYADRLLEYIDDHVNSEEDKEKPWMGFLSFQGVHCPLSAPEANKAKCKQENLYRRTLCGMIGNIDDQVGKIIQKLKDIGEYEDTVIIFTADNGGYELSGARNFPLRGGKGELFEGGMRGVNCVHYAKFDGYRVSNDLFHVTDWFPTFMGIAGNPRADYGDGYNQWPSIQGTSTTPARNMLIYNISPAGSAMRWNNYKLIIGQTLAPLQLVSQKATYPNEVYEALPADDDSTFACSKPDPAGKDPRQPAPFPADVTEFLFDLDEDPLELNNLAASKPSLVNRLKRILNQYMAQQVTPITIEQTESLRQQQRATPNNFNGTWATGWC
jgi:arylsulfatase B